jgi:glycosyltransferase involved in cell wall biosynthesis
MNKTQILYLSYDGMTDPLGQSQVLPYLIHLTKNGYQFTLVSCEKKERYQQNKAIIEKICFENNIDWQPIFYTKKPPVFSTIWDIIKLNKKVKQLHQQKEFQLIHCRSYITSLIGLAFKQNHNTKFIFDMRGFWADERVDGNLWNLKNPLFKWVYTYFKEKEKLFIQYADKVISLTENGKQEMLNWNIPNLQPEKIIVIPCAADYNLFKLITDEKRVLAKQNLGLTNNEFVLSYIGSIGTWYLLDEMLHLFSIFKKGNPAAKFLLLTPDSKDFILNNAKKYNLESTDFIIKFAQRQEIPTYAHASDFSIFFIKPAYSKKSSSPTKMGELLAMGIPLICNTNVGDVELIMKKINAGFCIEQLTEETFIETTQQIESWNLTQPQEIRENSKQFYDLENGGNLYLAIYKQLLK